MVSHSPEALQQRYGDIVPADNITPTGTCKTNQRAFYDTAVFSLLRWIPCKVSGWVRYKLHRRQIRNAPAARPCRRVTSNYPYRACPGIPPRYRVVTGSMPSVLRHLATGARQVSPSPKPMSCSICKEESVEPGLYPPHADHDPRSLIARIYVGKGWQALFKNSKLVQARLEDLHHSHSP